MKRLSGALRFASCCLAACGGGAVTPVVPAPSAIAPSGSVPAPAPSATPGATSLPPATSASAYAGHGAETVSAETLAKFAPPPLPPDLSRRIQSMLDVRAPGGGIVSPDGKHLYFTWTVTGVAQVWRIDGPQRFPAQMTGGEDATTLAGVSPDGKFLIVSRDKKGEEYPGLYLQSASGGPLTLIQHLPKVQTAVQFISDDSKSVYFRANDRRPDSYALYRWDVATGNKELLFDKQGIWSIDDHLPDGRLLLVKENGSAQTEYFELSPSGALTPLLGQGEKEEYVARYAADPGELVVMTPHLGNYRRLYRFSRKTKTLTPVSPDLKFDLTDSLAIDDTRRRVFFQVNENGFLRLHALDARTYKDAPLPPLPASDRAWLVSTAHSGKYAVVGLDTGKSPSVSYVIDWAAVKATEWQLSSAPEIDTSKFAQATLDTYPARDGTLIPMLVRRPESCKAAADPCPVVVSFHGGPEGQSFPGFSPRAQLFVDAGYVFVEPNVRGSDGYGKAWFHADDGPKRLDIITDIEDAAKYVRSAFAKNGKAPKVGIYGGSYGGYSTLIGMTMFAGAYDAGASIVGISNLVTFLANTAPYRRILRANEYGDLEKDHDALVKLSPTSYVDRVKAPILLIQGASDPRVPVGEALQFYEALQTKKVPSKLIIFPNEGHGSQRRENQVLQLGHVLEFFDTYLKTR